jgi:hypothetical protein
VNQTKSIHVFSISELESSQLVNLWCSDADINLEKGGATYAICRRSRVIGSVRLRGKARLNPTSTKFALLWTNRDDFIIDPDEFDRLLKSFPRKGLDLELTPAHVGNSSNPKGMS